MKELLNNPWVVGALCVAAAITVYLRLFDSKSSPTVPDPPVEPSVTVVAAPPAQPQTVAKSDSVESMDPSRGQAPIVGKWIDKVSRDPFQRVREEERAMPPEPTSPDGSAGETGALLGSPQPLRLRAIFMNGANRLAVINQSFVKVGDEVAGFRVSQIRSDGVWLQRATEEHWLEFTQQRIQDQVS